MARIHSRSIYNEVLRLRVLVICSLVAERLSREEKHSTLNLDCVECSRARARQNFLAKRKKTAMDSHIFVIAKSPFNRAEAFPSLDLLGRKQHKLPRLHRTVEQP
jgi:hypothetical protein